MVEVRNGSTTEKLAVILIGSNGYVGGTIAALEKILGLTAAQSTTYTNRWLSFPTSNASLDELVSGLLDLARGLRDRDVRARTRSATPR